MSTDLYCYCRSKNKEQFMFWCKNCKNYFHPGCLKSGSPSSLVGDILFHFTCANCNQEEEYERMKLQWTHIIMLTLYNLQLQGNARKGYFRWREHICAFIDKHWHLFHGSSRKKTSTWHGTVAGALSGGCPELFKSGAAELKESGWWTLSEKAKKLSSFADVEKLVNQAKTNKPKRQSIKVKNESPPRLSGLRSRTKRNCIEAAIELKEKRTSIVHTKRNRKSGSASSSTCNLTPEDTKETFPILGNRNNKEISDISDTSTFDWSHCDESADSWFTEKDLKPDETLPQLILRDDQEETLDDIEIESASQSPIAMLDSPQLSDILAAASPHQDDEKIDQQDTKTTLIPNTKIKIEPEINSASSDSSDQIRPMIKKRKTNIEPEEKKPQVSVVCNSISVYEEKLLLKKLDSLPHALALSPEARRLRRKLLVRKEKREFNCTLFDLDATMSQAERGKSEKSSTNLNYLNSSVINDDYRVLDRYRIKNFRVKSGSHQSPSFLTRLIGQNKNQFDGIISPYTSRVLKPFIWRDYETVPPKLKLLQEIISYPHRNDPTWKPPPHSPIDYCYVRPDHIPAVNALCREFYWPGIDLSECLQYPDFSCVVLYKWMIIGFAFMVPDVKWNEAYISFVLTHPDWRRAGIATFMIYHLLQTCMGKDVTLHVSATNPALCLYQKFGFKLEEFVVDFYDKYYPEDSQECKHAFFLRLPH